MLELCLGSGLRLGLNLVIGAGLGVEARTLRGIQLPSRCRLMALPARSDQVPLVAVTSRKRFWTGTTRSVSLPPGARECVFWGPSFAVCGQIQMLGLGLGLEQGSCRGLRI